MAEPVIQVENMCYTYPGGFTALSDINFTVEKNEFVGIIGQNGAGKSTLLKNITGLLLPAAGRVVVHGIDTRQATVSDPYTGFIGAAAVANYLGILIVKIPAKVWKVLAFVTPVERTIFAIGAAIIGIPLLLGLPKIGIFVGPQPKEEDDD